MARKRLVSPEFLTHPELCKLGPEAMLAFCGLWTQSDKRGIFRWRPQVLKLAIMPWFLTWDEFEQLLNTLEAAGFVRRYEVGGEWYGFIPSFGKWQTFHRMERPSDDPPPDEATAGTDDLLNGRQPSGWIPRATREAVLARDGKKCVECGSTTNLTLDHIHPYALGGSNEEANLRTLCRACNCKKGARVLQAPAITAMTPVTGTVAVAGTGTSAVAVAVQEPASHTPGNDTAPAVACSACGSLYAFLHKDGCPKATKPPGPRVPS